MIVSQLSFLTNCPNASAIPGCYQLPHPFIDTWHNYFAENPARPKSPITNRHMQGEPIWIVNQDEDDQEIIRTILAEAEVANEVKFFKNPQALLNELDQARSAPFIVMSDVNLIGMDGFELREKMLKTPNAKFHSVPFIFWSEHASPAQIKKAFDLRAHGFFIKDSSPKEWKQTFVHIILYWKKSKMPDKRDRQDDPLI
jgi:CheY-like chemotaxis protein